MKLFQTLFIFILVVVSCTTKEDGKTIVSSAPKYKDEQDSLYQTDKAKFQKLMKQKHFYFGCTKECGQDSITEYNLDHHINEAFYDLKTTIDSNEIYVQYGFIKTCCQAFGGDYQIIDDTLKLEYYELGRDGCACKCDYEYAFTITSKHPNINIITINGKVAENQTSKFNRTDENGLKQGRWEYFLGDNLWKVENYKDGLLNGKVQEYLANGEIRERNYVLGIREGYSLHYHPDSLVGRFISFYKHDSTIWFGFPEALKYCYFPVKEFSCSVDSVDVKIPYNTGELMYEGKIIQESNRGKPVGTHFVYYKSGIVEAKIDYDSDSLFIFDEKGKLTQQFTLAEGMKFKMKQGEYN